MSEERRSTTSVGARMRSGGSWGGWGGTRAADAPAGTPPPAPAAAELPLAPERTPAIHDVLTGLPNRILLLDRLDCALKRAARTRQRLAVAVVDLGDVGGIVDRHGAGTRDALVASTAQRLQQAVRASDTVARLGAKEFALVLEGVHTAAVAGQVAAKLLEAVRQPCTLLAGAEGHPVKLEPVAAIGVAVSPDHGRKPDELLAAATLAVARAWRTGGGMALHQEGADVRAARSGA